MEAEIAEDWLRTSFGYEHNGYRIVLCDVPPHRWRLDVRDDSSSDSPSWTAVSYHRRVRTAKAHAAGLARERLRTRRIVWRIVAGSMAMTLAFGTAMLPVSVAVVLVGMTSFAFSVRFWLEAAALIVAPGDDAFADSWPHLERLALAAADRARRRAGRRRPGGSPTPRVRALPPEPRPSPDEDGPAHIPASPMHVC